MQYANVFRSKNSNLNIQIHLTYNPSKTKLG